MKTKALHFDVANERRKEYPYFTLASAHSPGQDAEGQQIQLFGHTPGHINCPACELSKSSMESSVLKTFALKEAALLWLEEDVERYVKPSTLKSYKKYLRRLEEFDFPRLEQIHSGHLREYQRWREAGKYAASCINHDLNTLSQILEKAGLWKAIKDQYRPLPLPAWTPPRVLTDQEEEAFFKVAASKPDFALAYWVASLSNQTSATGCELRKLQLKHIDLESPRPILYVPSEAVKNEYRARVIPLNDRGEIQLRRILERARRLGASKPEHYLFPFRSKRNFFDPTRPASDSFIRKQWNKLVDVAIIMGAISFRVRPHDMRHQIVTKMLEAGIPEQTVMSITGHVSRQMLEHYSHQRIDAKSQAVDHISPDRKRTPRHEKAPGDQEYFHRNHKNSYRRNTERGA
jgi:integrase